jgi:hypothetical protein
VVPERRRRKRGARRRRRILIGAAIAAGVVAVTVAWCVFVATQVSSDLQDVRDDARSLADAIGEGDVARAEALLEEYEQSSSAAADSTDGITWHFMERLPFYGDDARAVAAVSEVLHTLGNEGVRPLVESAEQISARAFSPKAGQFPLAGISGLVEPATQSYEAFHQAANELADYRIEDFNGTIAKSFDELRTQIDTAETALDTAVRASRLMPAFLGAKGDRNYLYVFQNNAEVRSTGGLPGNVSLIHAGDGQVEIARQSSGGQLGEADEPALPLTNEELSVYGVQLGTYFLDSNFTPDFPRAADLWRARWEDVYGDDIDGIFTVDPVTLAYLLGATGPVSVQGIELTSFNVVQVVENLIYLNQPDPKAQDVFLNAVAKKVFDTFANGVGDPVQVIQALYRGVAEGRVRIHSFNEAEQAEVDGTEIAGGLPVEGDRDPHVGVYFNDATGSKMSYYLDYSVDVAAIDCEGDQQTLRGRLEISSKTPPDPQLLPEAVAGFDSLRDRFIKRGQQFVVGDVFAPVGGTISNIYLDGELLDPPIIERLNGRQLVSLAFLFEPRETHLVSWDMTTGPGQDGDTSVSVTPGVAPEAESSTVPSAC